MIRLALTIAVAVTLATTPILGQSLVVPGADGSDLALSPTADFTVDLSQATTGAWDQPSPNPGFGVYDSTKWAVVFKYTSVTIPVGVTVTFKNHPSGAPVVWLVSGSVQVDGTLSLDGTTDIKRRCSDPNRRQGSAPGPGGFRGGHGQPCSTEGGGPGHGPGGGDRSITGQSGRAQGGSHVHLGWTLSNLPYVGVVYGNGTLRRLVGGSGGGGSQAGGALENEPGGGGGGAILVAASGVMTINGAVTSRGGPQKPRSGGGSGGSVRLVASSLAGSGTVNTLAGDPAEDDQVEARGSLGRIRIEANDSAATWTTRPPVPLFPGPGTSPVDLWPATGTASAKIVTVDGITAPDDPHAQLALPHFDVGIAGALIDVTIETRNVDPATIQVRLRSTALAPDPGASAVAWADATYQSGNTTLATWSASISLHEGLGTLIAVISDL